MIFLHEIESKLAVNFKGAYYKDARLYVSIAGNTIISDMSSSLIDIQFYFLGLEQMIRSRMELNNLTVLSINCSIIKYKTDGGSETDDLSLDILYTAGYVKSYRSLTADDLVGHHFLTGAKSAFLYKGGSYILNFYLPTSEGIAITHHQRDGLQRGHWIDLSAGLGYQMINYSADIAKSVITMGSRSFTVYHMDDTPCETFSFRNFFNANETIQLPCSIESNPSTEYETASVGRVSIPYDVEHKEEFTLRSAPLHPAMADQLLWMVRSRSVIYEEKKGSAKSLVDIIIKDYKIIRSTEPNTPITFEMTFEYADTHLPSTLTL